VHKSISIILNLYCIEKRVTGNQLHTCTISCGSIVSCWLQTTRCFALIHFWTVFWIWDLKRWNPHGISKISWLISGFKCCFFFKVCPHIVDDRRSIIGRCGSTVYVWTHHQSLESTWNCRPERYFFILVLAF
jgi:hypothetical protein